MTVPKVLPYFVARVLRFYIVLEIPPLKLPVKDPISPIANYIHSLNQRRMEF